MPNTSAVEVAESSYFYLATASRTAETVPALRPLAGRNIHQIAVADRLKIHRLYERGEVYTTILPPQRAPAEHI
jgi:hypothetical protein